MAVDTHKGDVASNPLRTAMDRAGDKLGGLASSFSGRPALAREEGPLELTEVAEAPPLKRLDVKLALLNYVDANFRQRTSSDGTILAPSRELLVEQLTNLVMQLQDQPEKGPVKAKMPPHAHA